MKPYYDEGGITIYHGDALEVLDAIALPELAAVVTDPPYASGARTETARAKSGAMLRGQRWAAKPINNDQMTTTGFVWLIRQVALRLYPHLSDGGSVLSFIDWRQWPNLVGALETVNLRVQGMVVWDKGSMGLGNGFRAQHELIAHAAKGTPRIVARDTANVLTFKRERPVDHPSPKPPALMEALLRVVAEPGDLILDPFMGGGATLEAAANLGIGAIGIETEERYCEIAAQRLSQSVLQVAA